MGIKQPRLHVMKTRVVRSRKRAFHETVLLNVGMLLETLLHTKIFQKIVTLFILFIL